DGERPGSSWNANGSRFIPPEGFGVGRRQRSPTRHWTARRPVLGGRGGYAGLGLVPGILQIPFRVPSGGRAFSTLLLYGPGKGALLAGRLVMRRLVCYLLISGVGLLALADRAQAVYPPNVEDGGKFFKEETLAKANSRIRTIYAKYRIDVVVETFATIPP